VKRREQPVKRLVREAPTAYHRVTVTVDDLPLWAVAAFFDQMHKYADRPNVDAPPRASFTVAYELTGEQLALLERWGDSVWESLDILHVAPVELREPERNTLPADR
jgi:hypothetical protein